MNLLLKREKCGDACTLGKLYADSDYQCETLEDVVRPVKIHGRTAIPAGTYQVVVTMSPRFKRALPLLVNVPGFEGVRIHPGNTAANTEGCILVGTSRGKDSVLNSRAAFAALFRKIVDASKKGKVFIEIQNAA